MPTKHPVSFSFWYTIILSGIISSSSFPLVGMLSFWTRERCGSDFEIVLFSPDTPSINPSEKIARLEVDRAVDALDVYMLLELEFRYGPALFSNWAL